MKVIIAGSRNIECARYEIVQPFPKWRNGEYVNPNALEIVIGNSGNVDLAAKGFARSYPFPIRVFEADWREYGKAAGPIRNREMAEYADMLIAVWNGRSPGTKNMIDEMFKLSKPIFVYGVKVNADRWIESTHDGDE